jgi:hypothetical protein
MVLVGEQPADAAGPFQAVDLPIQAGQVQPP